MATEPGRFTYEGSAEAFHPGSYIRDELGAREWTQAHLAEVMGRPPRLVNDLCQERRSVSAETALDLARALGTSAELWINLQGAYDLAKARQRRAREVEAASA